MVGRSDLESLGYQVVEGFISPERCAEFLGLIDRYRKGHDLPVIRRPMKGRSLIYSVIDGEQIRQDLDPIWSLYTNGVYEKVQSLTQQPLHPLASTRVGVNINIMEPGGSEYRWHYDRTAVTAILYLNEVNGGQTEIYPNYRLLLKNQRRQRTQRLLDHLLHLGPVRNIFGKKIGIHPKAGRLVVLRGNRCWHSVCEVFGDTARINIILAYDSPDAVFPMESALDRYLYTQEKQTTSDPNYGSR